MTSLGVMIKRLGGMVDTVDLKPRENQFLKDIGFSNLKHISKINSWNI